MSRDHDHYGAPKPVDQLAGTMFDVAPTKVRPTQKDAQWMRILRALEQRPTMGYTRHELADLFDGTAHPIPLASVCRVVGEKLLPERLAEVSTVITRESKYHADNGVLYITAKGRMVLKTQVAA